MKYVFILFTLLISCSVAHTESEFFCEDYGYGKFGIGLPDLLNAGVGYRSFQGSHGYDISLSAGSCVLITDVNLKGLYLYRFSPDCPSSMYLGAGLGANFYSIMTPSGDADGIMASAEVSLGKSWTLNSGRKNFIQLVGSVPFTHNEMSPIPLMRLEYGISF